MVFCEPETWDLWEGYKDKFIAEEMDLLSCSVRKTRFVRVKNCVIRENLAMVRDVLDEIR